MDGASRPALPGQEGGSAPRPRWGSDRSPGTSTCKRTSCPPRAAERRLDSRAWRASWISTALRPGIRHRPSGSTPRAVPSSIPAPSVVGRSDQGRSSRLCRSRVTVCGSISAPGRTSNAGRGLLTLVARTVKSSGHRPADHVRRPERPPSAPSWAEIRRAVSVTARPRVTRFARVNREACPPRQTAATVRPGGFRTGAPSAT
jgi:hypothetical protein